MNTNPISDIDLDFPAYLQARQTQLAQHEVAGIPNYSFATDRTLRQQMASIKPLHALAQFVVSKQKAFYEQIYLMHGIAVGPQQYPEIYRLAEECARRLGIGLPQIFIIPDSNLNAATMAADDISPLVLLTSGLVDALEPEELLFVIGHECGHIHNLHGVYNTAVQWLTNPLAQMIGAGVQSKIKGAGGIVEFIVRGSIQLLLLRWSRCAEVTCDRAGLICCGNIDVAQQAFLKLLTGGSVRLEHINVEEFLRQAEQINSKTAKLLELGDTHPLLPKRIKATRAFANCDVLYSWRPEMPTDNKPLRTLRQTDALCDDIIRVVQS
ncbi:MAG: hypothetical protein DHS20C20_06380 [Ardenticatenaceae bacterium]|nr:MAG: hypothetical protein DHS20C20_06380 [Ardenticatenaceae bacterium]